MIFIHFLIYCLVFVIDVNSFHFSAVKSHLRHTHIGVVRKATEVSSFSNKKSVPSVNKVMSPAAGARITEDSRTEKNRYPVSLHPKQMGVTMNKPSSEKTVKLKRTTTSTGASSEKKKLMSDPVNVKRPNEHPSQSGMSKQKKATAEKLVKTVASEIPTLDESTSMKKYEKEKFSNFATYERVQKVIARCGVASRRDAEKMVYTNFLFFFFYSLS
jgi:hypothetical protein